MKTFDNTSKELLCINIIIQSGSALANSCSDGNTQCSLVACRRAEACGQATKGAVSLMNKTIQLLATEFLLSLFAQSAAGIYMSRSFG